MRFKRTWFTFIVVFLASILMAVGCEYLVYKDFVNPDRPVLTRHQFSRFLNIDSTQIVRHWPYDRSPLDFVIEVKQLDRDLIRGIRVFVGTYGQDAEIRRVRLTEVPLKSDFAGETSQPLSCVNRSNVQLRDNAWNIIPFTCVGRAVSSGPFTRFRLEILDADPVAFYQARFEELVFAPTPVLELYSDQAQFGRSDFLKARNYGELWSGAGILNVRIGSRIALCFALSLVLLSLIGAIHVKLVYLPFLMFMLSVVQLTETPSFHSPDETSHVVGLYREHAGELFEARMKELAHVANGVDFLVTKASRQAPISPVVTGNFEVAKDQNFVDPSTRSGIYSGLTKVIYEMSESLWEQLKPFTTDRVFVLKLSFLLVQSILVAGLFFILRGAIYWQDFFYVSLLMSLPINLTTYLTVWNYGFLTILGAFYSLLLLGRRRGHCHRLSLLVGQYVLVFVIAEIAKSQLSVLFLGSLATTYFSKDYSQKTLIKAFVLSWLAIVLFMFTVNVHLFPGMPLWFQDGQTLSPSTAKILTLSLLMFGGFFAGVCLHALKNKLQAFEVITLRFKRVGFMTLGLLLLLYLAVGLSFRYPTYIPSLDIPGLKPSFADFSIHSVRAVWSQFKWLPQDFFMIQTFFQAYGWYEVVGNLAIYKIVRHAFEFLVVVALYRIVRSGFQRTFDVGVLWTIYGIYFASIWFASWQGGFTMVGRFVLPLAGFIIVPIGQSFETRASATQESFDVSAIPVFMRLAFVFIVGVSLYGMLYLLPIRFVAGI